MKACSSNRSCLRILLPISTKHYQISCRVKIIVVKVIKLKWRALLIGGKPVTLEVPSRGLDFFSIIHIFEVYKELKNLGIRGFIKPEAGIFLHQRHQKAEILTNQKPTRKEKYGKFPYNIMNYDYILQE